MTHKFMEENSETPINKDPKENIWSLKEFIKFAIVATIIVLPIRFFIAEPYLVKQTSMIPTFSNNDYLIVEKLSYRFNEPKRGDVIVFDSPIEKSKNLIKRIIGLPGEIIVVNGEKTTIISKDKKEILISESYVKYESPMIQASYELKDGEYFVMGDNRAGSYDSRSWGPIQRKDIIGRPFLRLYHFSSIGSWPGLDVLPNDYQN
jgi:signal peptidase I